jgi:hypothetical protein
MRVDRQIAIVFELRNFRRYFPVTLQILRGSKTTWQNHAGAATPRLLHEVDIAIGYIEKRIGKGDG